MEIPAGDSYPHKVVVVSACRTPIGKLSGALSSLPAHRLGALVITEALRRANVLPNEVDEVILGQVLTGGQGQNPARQAAVLAGLPVSVPASSVQMVCGSGLKALVAGYQAICIGDARIVVAGGQESMSQAPHVVHMRNPVVMGDAVLKVSWDEIISLPQKVRVSTTSAYSCAARLSLRICEFPLICHTLSRTSQGRGNLAVSTLVTPKSSCVFGVAQRLVRGGGDNICFVFTDFH